MSTAKIPSACCLGSIGQDGYPNARFVSLKEVVNDTFVITGPLNSRKGTELLANPKASLAFWWAATERQVRIQGDAIPIDNEQADRYFKERSRESQIVSIMSQQGQQIENHKELIRKFEQQTSEKPDTPMGRPPEWSGFYIHPQRIEFMEFNENRFHFRELFSREGENWTRVLLQP